MGIVFLEEDNPGMELRFKHVKDNEFFVNWCGHLCQKTDQNRYCQIALSDGTPMSGYYDCNEDQKVKIIYRDIVKIKFN